MPEKKTPEQKAQIVDEYGELSRAIAHLKLELNPKQKRADHLAGEIRSWYEFQDPSQTYVVEGKRYLVEVGAREFRRVITKIRKLAQLLGTALFYEHASIPLKIVDSLIPEDKDHLFLVKDRTGSRELKAVAKVASIADGKKLAA